MKLQHVDNATSSSKTTASTHLSADFSLHLDPPAVQTPAPADHSLTGSVLRSASKHLAPQGVASFCAGARETRSPAPHSRPPKSFTKRVRSCLQDVVERLWAVLVCCVNALFVGDFIGKIYLASIFPLARPKNTAKNTSNAPCEKS